MSYDLVVIGAGAVGLGVAWRAARRGLSTLVLDRDAPGHGTSSVAAGMIAPVSEAVASEEPLLRLALASAQSYPRWVAELTADSGLDPGFRRCGTLMVARDGDEAAALEREQAIRRALGLEVARLLPSAARRLEPALAPGIRLALHAPDDHAIDPRALCAALVAALRARGGTIRCGAAVASVERSAGRASGVRLRDGELVRAVQVVLAAGVWSGSLAGVDPALAAALRPVKGQIMRLREPAGRQLLERVLRAEDCYLVPRGEGVYVLGGTIEERGFDRSITAGGLFELLDAGRRLLPAVDELVIDDAVAGLRPGTVDNAPLLGADSSGLVWATGHYRHGILLTPATAELIAAELAGEAPPPELCQLSGLLTRFAPTRFLPAAMTPREDNHAPATAGAAA